MNKRQWILGLVVLAALSALALWARNRVHFDFRVFAAQIALADWRLIALGAACIYVAFVFRAFRWSLLVRHRQKVTTLSLLGTQVIGFAAVALIGRVADPVRPYLVARKTGLSLGSQIAVYIVERLLDAGSMALIFSVAMIWIPGNQVLYATAKSGPIAGLVPHHQNLALFVARYGGLCLTLLGTLFLFAVRLAGGAVAQVFETVFGLMSKNLGRAVAHKIRQFHSGLDTMRSFGDFAAVTGTSLTMWLLITVAYFVTCRAFPDLPAITPPKCVLLMVASGTASVLQLPVVGWFSQIGLVAVAISGILGAGAEAATACATTLLLTTFLAVIPVGLIWAQFEHIDLRKVTLESERAEEVVAEQEAADSTVAS